MGKWKHREYQIHMYGDFDIWMNGAEPNILEAMPEFKHEFPLIEKSWQKQDARAITARLHVKRPVTYDMDFRTTIVLDVSKGRHVVLNQIRKYFPEVFQDNGRIGKRNRS